MIAVDSSALVAIVLAEADHGRLWERMRASRHCIVSSVSVIESRIVVYSRLGEDAVLLLDQLLSGQAVEIAPPGPKELDMAWKGFRRFGKGSGHRAALNLGDLFSNALAKTRNIPLLFKGNDFRYTDIVPALAVNGGVTDQ